MARKSKQQQDGEAAFSVDVQNVECSAARASVTGSVNGRQVAATVLLAQLPAGAADQVRKKQRTAPLTKALAEALVDAYLGEDVDPETTHAGMVTVRR